MGSQIKSKIYVNFFLNGGPTIHQTKFPPISAFACTVHKVERLALPNIDVSFESSRQKKSAVCNYM